MTEPAPRKSDLGVRVVSAVVMVAVAGTALWLGGWWWNAFVAAVALGVLFEWIGLVANFAPGVRIIWIAGGFLYVALAAITLAVLRTGAGGLNTALGVIAVVAAVDVGAYFAGRALGGPKIAPRISPSKTWAGLGGGILAAALVFAMFYHSGVFEGTLHNVGIALMAGGAFAVMAQAGDFFESWMKRRAGVKDSGGLIPGHGGLFDRVDGLMAVSAAIGLIASLGTVRMFIT